MIGGFQPVAFQTNFQQFATVSSGAGRSKRRRRNYYVEIDGQTFLAESESHAQAILDRAADLAERAATEQAQQVVEKRLAKSVVRVVAPVQLAEPEISTNVPIDLEPYRQRIARAYAEAERLAEMRLMMERQMALEDEEEALLLLL